MKNMKKIVFLTICLLFSFVLCVSATADNFETETYEYTNGISITSPASTITQADATLQLTAVILDALPEESIIWSIESGKNCATIDQNGLLKAVTNGVVVCKAKSTVDESRFAYKTIIISIQTQKQWAKLDLMGVGCSFKRMVNGEEKTLGAYLVNDFVVGTEFDLEAVAKKSNMEFLYWKGSDGRIISYDPKYKFILGTDMKLTAVYAEIQDESYHVVFRDISGKILAEGPTTSTISVPALSNPVGYEFYCWIADKKQYDFDEKSVFEASSVNKNTIFTAGYVKSSIKYNLTVENADVSTGSYYYNDVVTLNHILPPSDKKFAYWKRDGQIVSYSDTYTFYMGAYDTKIEAVFVDISEPVAEVPIVVMSEPIVTDTNKISFTAERYLPEQYTLVATGIILNNSSANITLDTYGIKNSMSASFKNIGQYTVRKKDVSDGETWYARGYMIYADADNIITVYSDTVSKSLN